MKEATLEKAIKTTMVTGIVLCAVLSGFFTMIGAAVGMGKGPLITPRIELPMPIWIMWGVAVGAGCGGLVSMWMIVFLMRKRKKGWGFRFGLVAGLLVGGLNGFLTGTMSAGVVLGIILGPPCGWMVASLFLSLYREK